MRVLIFDDDAAIGRLAVRVATMSGMAAVAVVDAEAFAQRLQHDAPDVVLLDLQLGDTDGVEQLRLLAERHYSGMLVLMSGFDARVLDTARALGQSLGLNIACALQKPLSVAALEQAFERLQSGHQSLSAERLMQAIADDELALDFQPIVSRAPNVLKKLEALVRWEHPAIGRIAPDKFLPLAESDTAVIDALTGWVLGAAVEAYKVLAELGVHVPLAVNISPQNLHDRTLPDRIEQRLKAGGMPARHLCLEVTESAAFSDPSCTMDILSRVRLKGMQLSIDDFGTGYSSLKMLRQMPFTEIKIDRSFVHDVTTSRESRAIVKSIMDMAANMEMTCVAEGVESEQTAVLLEQLGVGGLQGYLIAQPMPVEAIPAWLAIWTRGDSAMATAGVTTSATECESGNSTKVAALPVSVEAGSENAHLSPRQVDVLRVLSEGCSVKEIARKLGISPGTVKVHLSLAYSALGARNRIEAVTRAGMIQTAGYRPQPAGNPITT